MTVLPLKKLATKILFWSLFLFSSSVLAQLPAELDCKAFTLSPFLDTTCGFIDVRGGTGSTNVFCEGIDITLVNNTPASVGLDYTLYCWRDGTDTLVKGNGGATHRYTFPNDTCIRNNRNITRQIYMIGFKRCGQSYSVNYIIIPVEISVKPKAFFKLEGVACVDAETKFVSESCPNAPSNETSYLWEFGDGETSTSALASVTHRYKTAQSYTVKLTVTNKCGSKPYTQTINVIGQPKAKAEVLSGTQSTTTQPFPVCLSNGSATVEVTGRNSLNSTGYKWIPSSSSMSVIPKNDTVTSKVNFTQEGEFSLVLESRNECKPSYDTLRFRVIKADKISINRINNDCDTFTYYPKPFIAGAKYEHFFNGISQGFFDFNKGFVALFGTHKVLATLSNECDPNQKDSISFTVAPAQEAQFLFPTRDTTVCKDSGLIFIAVSPKSKDITGTNNLITRNDSLFLNPSVAGTVTLNYTIGAAGKCQGSATRIITISEVKQVKLTPQADRCKPFYYKIDARVPNAIYTLNGNPFSDSVYVDTGTYTVRVTLPSFCGVAKDSIRFKVTGIEKVKAFSHDTTVCIQGGSFQLKGTGGNWLTQQGLDNGMFDPLKAGIGTHIATLKGGTDECADSISIRITVQGVPNVDAGNDTAICKMPNALPISLNKGKPVGGIYTAAGQRITAIDPSVWAAGIYKILYTVTDTAAPLHCSTYDSLTVIINDIPKATAKVPASTCVGLETQLEALNTVPTETYEWFVNGVSIGSTAVLTYIFPSDGEMKIMLVVSNASKCNDTYTQNITVRRAPRPSFKISQTAICSGQWLKIENEATLNDPITSYQWQFRGKTYKLTQIDSLLMTNTGCQDSTYTLKLSVTTGLCKEIAFERNITVYPKLTARIAGIQGQADSICSNQDVLFVDSSCGKIKSYVWYIDGKKFMGRVPQIQNFNNNSDTIRRINIILVVESGEECPVFDTAYYRLGVYPLSIRARFTFNNKIGCAPFEVRFRSLTPYSNGVLYYFGDGTTSSNPNPTKIYDNPGVYLIRFRVYHPCGGYDDYVDSITVKKSAKSNGLSFEKVDKCNEFKIRIKPHIQYGVLGRIWVDSLNMFDATGNAILVFPRPGAYWVKDSILNESTGCAVIDSGLVVINSPFQLDTIVSQDSCGNGNGKVDLLAKGGSGSYLFSKRDTTHWQKDNEFRGLRANESYTFFAQDSTGCWLSKSFLMQGGFPRSINVGADTLVNICDSFYRQVSAKFPIKSISWKIKSGEGIIATPNNIKTMLLPFRTSEIYVLAIDSLGCKAEGTFNITVNKELSVYIPTSFSPNDDGINDYFLPYFGSNALEIVEFYVFTRWGELVHSAKNVLANDPSLQWDGKHKGELLKPDVFAWWLRFKLCNKDIEKIEKGDVTLIR